MTNMTNGHQIALWDDALRTLPMAFARSALFRVASKSARNHLNGEIAAGEGIRIRYSGEELRTDDEEVLMLLLHKLRGRDCRDPENLVVEISRFEMLRELDRRSDGRYYAELNASLDRMAIGGLLVSYKGPNGRKYRMTQTLIRKVAYADEKSDGKRKTDGRIKIWLEPEVLQFFTGDSESERFSIVWRERASLSRPLAKWLHSHLHALGFGLTDYVVCRLDVIWRLSGSEASTSKSFRVILQRTLEDMKAAEVIGEWVIRKDLFCVTRPGKSAQISWTADEATAQQAFSLLELNDAESIEPDDQEEVRA